MSNESKCQLSSPTALSVSLAIKLQPGFVMVFAGLGVEGVGTPLPILQEERANV